MSAPSATYTPYSETFLDCRLPLLPDAQVRRIRASVTCEGFAAYKDSLVFRIPAAQRERLEQVLEEPVPQDANSVVALYHDFNIFFSYMATSVSDKLEREYQIRLDWRGFEVFPPWRPFVTVANDLVVSRWKPVRRMADAAGLPVSDHRPIFRRTRNAMAALEYAKLTGMERVLRDALYKAFWVDDLDIEDPSILKDLAYACGVDGSGVEDAVITGRFSATLDYYRQMAIAAGVFGTPTFIVGRDLVWAREPYSMVVEALERAAVARR